MWLHGTPADPAPEPEYGCLVVDDGTSVVREEVPTPTDLQDIVARHLFGEPARSDEDAAFAGEVATGLLDGGHVHLGCGSFRLHPYGDVRLGECPGCGRALWTETNEVEDGQPLQCGCDGHWSVDREGCCEPSHDDRGGGPRALCPRCLAVLPAGHRLRCRSLCATTVPRTRSLTFQAVTRGAKTRGKSNGPRGKSGGASGKSPRSSRRADASRHPPEERRELDECEMGVGSCGGLAQFASGASPASASARAARPNSAYIFEAWGRVSAVHRGGRRGRRWRCRVSKWNDRAFAMAPRRKRPRRVAKKIVGIMIGFLGAAASLGGAW